jgi:hypothetical protein
MRILVLVLGARVAPFPRLIRTIKETWASIPVEGVETLYYYGGDRLVLDGDDLVLPVSDALAHIGYKTIACFEWALANRDFDLTFRANCSSYVDLANLRGCVHARALGRGSYAGFIGVHHDLRFASGSGYFLGRDLVELAVEQQESWRHDLLDDAALASLLADNGVRPEHVPRVDYRNARDVENVDITQFHFRCRTASWRRREDALIMRKLYRTFCEVRGVPSRRDRLMRRILSRRVVSSLDGPR